MSDGYERAALKLKVDRDNERVWRERAERQRDEARQELEQLRGGVRAVVNDMVNTEPRDEYWIERLRALAATDGGAS